jgi:hypothetical protein
MKARDIKGFKKNGVKYRWCSMCDKKHERFVSKDGSYFNGIKWAIKHGYKPILK